MKNKIAKILGAVLTVVTLASLFVFAGPVSAAAPDQSWNTLSNPSATGLVMPNNITYTGPVIRAPADATGATLFAYIEQGTTFSLIRSTNFGRTWTSIATPAGRVACMVSAATDANTLYYAINTPAETVYKSSNALATSVTWVPEVNAPTGAGQIVSINAMLFGGRYLVAIGTNNVGGAANVYWMDESIPFFSFATLGTSDFATAVGGGVTSVIAVYFSPNFTADRALFAVGAKAASTVLAVNVAGGDWTGAMGTATLPNTSSIAQIFFPSDYNFATFPRFFLAVNGASTALYWFIGGATSALVAIPPTGIPGITGQIDSFDGNGAFASANLMVGTTTGQVFISANGGATWNVPTKAPTGTGACLVIMKSDFATSHAALAFKVAAAANDESGVSITQDSGLTYNQISLLNSSITNIYSLALGSAYTFAAGGNGPFNSTLVPGGTFTVTNGGVAGSSFTVTATNSGDSLTLTALATGTISGLPFPGAQHIAITGGIIGTDFSITASAGVTVIGNDIYLNAATQSITIKALRDNVVGQLTVNGSMLAGRAFDFINITKPVDDNGNATYATNLVGTTDVGTLNFALPDNTNDTFSYTIGAGTVSTVLTGGTTNVGGTVKFADPGDTITFNATTAATIVNTAQILTYPLGNAVLNNAGTLNFPGATTLTNIATNSVVTFSGAYASLTPTLGGIATFSSGILTFSALGTVSFQNNTITAAVIGATTGAPAATTTMGTFPIVGYSVSAQVPVATTYTNFVWRYELATGNWERVQFASGQPAAQNIINLSATGNALFLASAGMTTVTRSLDNGQNWAPMIFATPGPIYSIVAVDPLTVVSGGVNNSYLSLANGFWNTTAVALGNITSLAVSSSGTSIVAGGTAGKYATSTNNGTTWSGTSNTGTGAVTYPSTVQVGFEFGSTSVVYATATGVAGVFRGGSNVDNNAAALDSSANSLVTSGAGVGYGNATSPNTVEYAIDASDGYVARITNSAGSTYTAGNLALATNNASGLWVQAAAGKNSLWGIFGGNKIMNYIDYLAVSVTGVTVPAATITPTSAVVSWTAVTAGTSSGIQYQVSITTGSTALKNPYTSLPLAGTQTGLTTTSATFTGLANFTQYTVSVWVVAPVVSFYGSATFTTQLAAPVGIAPVAPANQTVPIVPSFSWTSVPGATGYTLWISQSDPTFATKTVLTVAVSGNPVSALNWTGTPLANNTTYYWEVQATAGTAVGPFSSIYGFTTVVAQLPAVTVTQSTTTLTATSVPVPTIVVNLPPVVTVTQNAPAPTPILTVTQPTYTIAAQETTTPTYIWIIVGIGALLTLAVIILIIRTRRVV